LTSRIVDVERHKKAGGLSVQVRARSRCSHGYPTNAHRRHHAVNFLILSAPTKMTGACASSCTVLGCRTLPLSWLYILPDVLTLALIQTVESE